MTTRDEGGQKSASRKTEDVAEVEDLDTSDVQERHAELTDDVDDILDRRTRIGLVERDRDRVVSIAQEFLAGVAGA